MATPFRGKLYAGGEPSFETYFLRDLYQRGKLPRPLIEEIATELGYPVSVDALIDTFEDARSGEVGHELVQAIRDVAAAVFNAN